MKDQTTDLEYLRQIVSGIRISTDKDSGATLPFGTRYVTMNENQAKALRRLPDMLASIEKDKDDAMRLLGRLQSEDYNADCTNLRGAVKAFLAERPKS